MSPTTYAKALNAALRDALTEDPDVLVMGEDVGALGGVFRITDGLTRDFGEDRCVDTPLAEAGIAGFAVGLAMQGFRPVVEMQFDAFGYPAFEQVTSHIAKMRNRTRGALPMPLVIRIPYAGGIGGVEHHCDSSEGYYVHTPGLHVVTPATPADAYSLLRESIASDDPVVFMEPKSQYYTKADLELPTSTEPIGQAAVRREGSDVTLVTYGPQLATALKAAEVAAAEEDWDVEVIDLRTLVPFDDATVEASVRRTGRAVVLAEAQGFAGMGAEIAARVQERCFHSLAAPVLRVSGLDIPYPPPKLEHTHLPGVDRILDTIARLQWDDEPDHTHTPHEHEVSA
ncbi:2-oxoisovalerate dehydrogenase [Serinicoccus sp. CNJ-927]|uniref:alpha-ketoacid dehydrogenase subunit beta n=1 Tax=unclassified Serinicoccus TaxID=2643101 RepID=UPI000962B4ED|nr:MULTISPECIES: alpha-ketoacid dehydrogenase subunit beta [unclassified Serinicoccus]OLT16633.1 2-oxoisovalerate dehydrogenase [Serinicoccus sp. CUA-874]OLT41851.1 2-oxoisovalerate dehydrogenase [Serinicoccus sp. CNJ-927]